MSTTKSYKPIGQLHKRRFPFEWLLFVVMLLALALGYGEPERPLPKCVWVQQLNEAVCEDG